MMLGVNRIIQGRAVPNPVGEPSFTAEQEKKLRRRYIDKALELLQKDVEGPTVVTLENI
jgi:glycine reductase complex component B subunit gamma